MVYCRAAFALAVGLLPMGCGQPPTATPPESPAVSVVELPKSKRAEASPATGFDAVVGVRCYSHRVADFSLTCATPTKSGDDCTTLVTDRIRIRRRGESVLLDVEQLFTNFHMCFVSAQLDKAGDGYWRGLAGSDNPCRVELRVVDGKLLVRGDKCRQNCGARGFIDHEYPIVKLRPCSWPEVGADDD